MRGHPDYNAADISFFSVHDPNSDVIAERSGFSRLDNRGRVIWFDDFRQGLKRWQADHNATGAIPRHIHSDNLSIGYYGCIEIDPIANNGVSFLDTDLVLPVSSKLGVEVGLRVVNNWGEIRVTLEHIYSGSNYKYGSFFIEQGTGKLYIAGASGNTLLFTPSSSAYYQNSWISIKMVIDFENSKFLRLLLGNAQYDLTQSIQTSAGAALTGATSIRVQSSGYNPDDFEPSYIGYVIVSGDEP